MPKTTDFDSSTRVEIRLIQQIDETDTPKSSNLNYRIPQSDYDVHLHTKGGPSLSPTHYNNYNYNSPNHYIKGYSTDRREGTLLQMSPESNYNKYKYEQVNIPTCGLNITHNLQHPYSFHEVGFEPPCTQLCREGEEEKDDEEENDCPRRPLQQSLLTDNDRVLNWPSLEEGMLIAGLLESQGINPMKHSNLTDLYMKRDFFKDLRKCLTGSYLVRYHPRKVGELTGPDPVERFVLIRLLGLFNGIPQDSQMTRGQQQPIKKKRKYRVKHIDELPRIFPRGFIQTRSHKHPKSEEFGRYGLAALVGVTRDISTPGFGPHRVYHDGHVGPEYLEQMIVPIMPHPITGNINDKNTYRCIQKRYLEALHSKVIGLQGDRLLSSKQFKLLHADNAFTLWFYDVNTGKVDIVELCAPTAALADLWVRTMKGIVSVNSCRFAPKPNKLMLATAEESLEFAARRMKTQEKLGILNAEWKQGDYYHNIGNYIDDEDDSDDDGTWINRRMPSIEVLHAMCRHLFDNSAMKNIQKKINDNVRWI
eukprot:Tbor_TRINITY_DN5436_c0_g4::TRINITY_DN5436_c0_g4_i2::g.24905::m.24905